MFIDKKYFLEYLYMYACVYNPDTPISTPKFPTLKQFCVPAATLLPLLQLPSLLMVHATINSSSSIMEIPFEFLQLCPLYQLRRNLTFAVSLQWIKWNLESSMVSSLFWRMHVHISLWESLNFITLIGNWKMVLEVWWMDVT